jgi:uncharacterized membrane protein
MSIGALYMDAVITPNRSLSQRGIVVIVAAMGTMSLIPMTFAIILGAPFPPMFLGLDVLGVWFALHVATRRKAAPERVQVSSDAVRVLKGERPVWTSPTAFTRIDVEGEGDELRVWLRLSRKSLAIAQALSPPERDAFAAALKDAVRDARAERHPT